MSEAALLRALADKLDALDSVSAFPLEITDPGEVTVGWSEGADHPGYPALSAAIAALVTQHWNALRSQVLTQREGEVQTARSQVSGLSGGERSTAVPPSVEAALRKVAG